MLAKIHIPGLFVTGTDTEVGKTVVAGAIADWFRRCHLRVGVCKPFATGCVRRREGLVSEDAEFLAYCADAKFPLDLIAPQRWSEPLAPAVAAERAGAPADWESVARSFRLMSAESDVMVVEGIGGLMTPLDPRHTVRDLIGWLQLPVIVVARAGLGTINHTLLTLVALRDIGATVAGVVINRYPADASSIAEETNPRAIERWGKTSVLCVVPAEQFVPPKLPAGITAAIDTVDWGSIAREEIANGAADVGLPSHRFIDCHLQLGDSVHMGSVWGRRSFWKYFLPTWLMLELACAIPVTLFIHRGTPESTAILIYALQQIVSCGGAYLIAR